MHGPGRIVVCLTKRFPKLKALIEILPQMPCTIHGYAKRFLVQSPDLIKRLQGDTQFYEFVEV